MNKHIQVLENNDGKCDCVGPWGTFLLLAVKPHQERCTGIKEIIWRLCVSYRLLNSATRSFEFSIPRYTNIIENFGDSSGPI